MGQIALDGRDTARPTFVAPDVAAETSLVARLTVSDGTTSVDDEVTIVVKPQGTEGVNRPPVANAGEARSVGVGSEVVLDASGSSDPDGDTLSFVWTSVDDASVVLASADTVAARFTAPAVTGATAYTFRVEVRDGRGGVDLADVTVTVDPAGETVDETKLLDVEEGCGCAATSSSSGSWGAVLLLAGLLVRRRK
jgi:MYXO-CTERM domain-containing protein